MITLVKITQNRINNGRKLATKPIYINFTPQND